MYYYIRIVIDKTILRVNVYPYGLTGCVCNMYIYIIEHRLRFIVDLKYTYLLRYVMILYTTILNLFFFVVQLNYW